MTRPAEEKDFPALIEMGKRFAEAEYAGKIAVDPSSLESLLKVLREGPKSLLLVSEDEGGAVRGAVGAFLFFHPISGELVCGEAFWWVDEGYRGRGIKLMKKLEQWAAEHRAAVLSMVAPNGRVAEFYERTGYDKVETTYQKRLK